MLRLRWLPSNFQISRRQKTRMGRLHNDPCMGSRIWRIFLYMLWHDERFGTKAGEHTPTMAGAHEAIVIRLLGPLCTYIMLYTQVALTKTP